MEKTAVEWFWETIKNTAPSLEWYNILEQALEMEKQQIMDAHWEASEDTDRAEEYYNRKFK